MPTCDFAGWATKNDLRCSDGRIIRKDAFKVQDGRRVPLVWNHRHESAMAVLGHAILENRDEGVYAYCTFNDSESGKHAKECVKHGDVTSLSIWANNLEQTSNGDVLHGIIREVSLVHAGANPGAFIESVMAHGMYVDESDDQGIIYTGCGLELMHADDPKAKDPKKGEEKEVAAENKEKTVGEVFNTLTEEQKQVVYAIVGMAVEDARSGEEDGEEGEEEEMKHNIFDGSAGGDTAVLSHSDMKDLMAEAKRVGSLRDVIAAKVESGELVHAAIPTTGMTVGTGTSTYGFNDPEMLFPDYRTLVNTPEWLSRNMDWVQKVMSGVHHTPFSRIKSVYANITEDDARARGYIKGKQKKTEVFTTLKRTTDPQTVYKLQKMDRDDVIDITDFDVIAWIKAEMRVMLNEEIARAILIGDGRSSDSDDKIKEANIRPIAKDVGLFNTKIEVNVASTATESEIARATINSIVRGRKNYKGSGNPTFFTTEDVLTEMLLLEDGIGHKMYKTVDELATALRVSEIITVEPMEGQKVDDLPLAGIIVNLSDYNVGADKGGEVNMFDDFDLDFNKYEYLIETRISGALIKPFSALTILVKKAAPAGGVQQGS